MFKMIGRDSKSSLYGWILAVVLNGGVASGTPIVTGGGQGGVTTDLFDISQGATIVSNSAMLGCCGGSLPQNALGGSGGVEGPNTLFSDGPPAGTVEFINFQLPQPIRLTNYTATLADDSDNPANIGDPNRGSTAFRLYTSPDANFTSLQLVSEAALTPGYINTYGTNAILINDTLTNVTGQFFRLEMVRATAGGPRIRELDGFGTPVPEPAGAALLLLAPLGFMARRRSIRP
jgi:hypothetical protein